MYGLYQSHYIPIAKETKAFMRILYYTCHPYIVLRRTSLAGRRLSLQLVCTTNNSKELALLTRIPGARFSSLFAYNACTIPSNGRRPRVLSAVLKATPRNNASFPTKVTEEVARRPF
ncbi:hypothetical protein CDAR_573121 [Caerostris darwini]|uniref:Uncharacterized protein n=1 Tax=Caerostris darwini TaxID=1538125 RepID=A0AAV4W8M1_9ARAC|nr:hypothetical protein CDAR_573121 [Caerostris darwini]